MQLDKKDVIIVKFLWIMKALLAHVVIDNYVVCQEVEKVKKDI
jgi:hypothetical protein